MNFSRRQILSVTGASLLVSLLAWWQGRKTTGPAADDAKSHATLRAWIDTLLPAEPDFPGALALGVDERIRGAMQREPAYARLGVAAVAWVDAQARAAGGTSFAELAPAQRNQIVAAAAASPVGSAERTFFQATLDDALFHAYADQRAWVGLGYAGPPQPIGFPDYAAPPRST